MNMSMNDALQTFLAESRGLLQAMEQALLHLEDMPNDDDLLNEVFRAAHTIKGSAGLFGLDAIVAFTHEVESVLDLARDGKLAIDESLSGLLLECADHMAQLLHYVETNTELDEQVRSLGIALIKRLQVTRGITSQAQNVMEAMDSSQPLDADATVVGASDTWHISLRFDAQVLRHGLDPAAFIRYLGSFGVITHITTLHSAMPMLNELDPECCYLGFEIRYRSAADKTAIEAAFEFVRDDCQLRILPPGSRIDDYIRLIEALPEDNLRLGELLVFCGAVTQHELDAALQEQQEQEQQAHQHQPLGQILVSEHTVQAEVVNAALSKQGEARTKQTQEVRFIRVHADKLDALINQVGELVIAGAGVALLAQRNKDSAMLESMSSLSRLVEEVRDSAMRLRMVEIGETFIRFKRVVRDVSKELGKEIELVITGAETELDKSVVERIGDPLMHLVRNAMDHGVESAELRASRGKPMKATIELKAFHEAGGIVIEVRDDGSGLNRERILAKAVERGLLTAEQTSDLSDDEVWKLVFEPGFSTAAQVSNLSGRGVGMDVVKRGIEALRGSIEIHSQAGLGSTIRIHLPLTLAIIDGFLMAVADVHFVVPLDRVIECVEIDSDNCPPGRDYIDLRNEVLPLLRLKEHFALQGQPSRRQNVVVVHTVGRKAGLVVDQLKGELQAVIKPMGRLFAQVQGLSGSTILGSGEVALVLDIPALLDDAIHSSTRRPALLST